MAPGGRTVMRTAVITGGAGGLGRAMAGALQKRGWHAALIDLPGPELDSIVVSDSQSAWPCDLTDSGQLARTCDAIRTIRPSIDMVVYNAGITHIGLFAESDVEIHRRVLEINYFAAIATASHFLEDLRRSKGTHLAISSVAGFSPLVKRTAYAASKHALEGFFASLRSEERPHGVRTVIAAPSFVATNMDRPQTDERGLARPGSASDSVDLMSPRRAAEIILKGLDRSRETIPVGRVARIAWLLNRLSPRTYQRIMERRMQSD
jgi:NAD(P)-dependent dehydrogenase (short-subunit alcohol dehydrogenase family)